MAIVFLAACLPSAILPACTDTSSAGFFVAGVVPRHSDSAQAHSGSGKRSPASRGFSASIGAFSDYITSGSLKASISPANSLIGMQLQNTFLSPCTLSTRATGDQYFCNFNVASGNAASSRG